MSTIELALFGQKIHLKHGFDDPLFAEEVARLVTRKVKEAQARGPKAAAPHHVALIALLEIAAEYLQARSRVEDYQRELEGKVAELKTELQSSLRADAS